MNCAACKGDHLVSQCLDKTKLHQLANDRTKVPERAPNKTDPLYEKFVSGIQERAKIVSLN